MAQITAGSRLWVPLAAVWIVACSGCGGASTTTTQPAAAKPVTPAFPLTLTTSTGAVTILHRPSRIISLSASATEDLYAVGAGKQVVAVDSYSTYPKNAPRTKLSGFTPNVEAIAGYQPDLVVVSDDTNHIVAELGKLHIPALVEPPPANLLGAYAQIDQIARATGHQAAAERVVATIRHRVTMVVRSVPRPRRPLTVYHELDQTYYSATSDTFIGQMYALLGLHNIADKAKASSDYPQLSAEYIIASNPDLIVLADTVCCGQTRATVADRPGWANINAVKIGEVVPVNDSIASEWGPRIVLFLKAVAAAVKRLEGHPK
jgi:iron complex transport system substrate-binding protein